MYKILGLRQEIKESGNIEDILCLRYSNNFYEIRDRKLVLVKRFLGITHLPINKLFINLEIDENNNIINSNYSFNLSLDFKPTNRMMRKRPVWIFYGQSGLGKSFIGNLITEYGYLKVYETDTCINLPEVINEDVIILGNKYKFEIDDIKNRLNDREVILVNFNSVL